MRSKLPLCRHKQSWGCVFFRHFSDKNIPVVLFINALIDDLDRAIVYEAHGHNGLHALKVKA